MRQHIVGNRSPHTKPSPNNFRINENTIYTTWSTPQCPTSTTAPYSRDIQPSTSHNSQHISSQTTDSAPHGHAYSTGEGRTSQKEEMINCHVSQILGG